MTAHDQRLRGPARALLVIDQSALADSVRRALNHGHCSMRVAPTVDDAAHALSEWRPHLVVLDMDSAANPILERLADAPRERDRLPVIALTRRSDLHGKQSLAPIGWSASRGRIRLAWPPNPATRIMRGSKKGAFVRKAFLSLVVFVATLVPAVRPLANAPAPVYVTLWFDTEDYLLPQDDDATKRLAELLSRLGVRATFKIVGEKARVLEQRRRSDVIAALKRHDMGYHSNTHSQQPTIAVYLQNAGWEDGRAEFKRREESGVHDIERIFGVTPVAYGQPGSAWAPQTYPALRDLGIKVYLDEADQVGVDDQPFYYGGMLNIFRMRSTLVRMALSGGTSLIEGQAAFNKVHAALTARGGGTISIYYHPNEWVQAEFWDAVNFRRGANPPPDEWKPPRTRPATETEQAFADFEQFIRFIQARDGVRFVTATELAALYADRALGRDFGPTELLAVARAVQKDFDFLTFDGYALSGADMFTLLTDTAAALVETKAFPAAIRLATIDGPTRTFTPSTGQLRSSSFRWSAFASAVRDTADYCRVHRRMPDEVWIGAENIPPVDYLATLGYAVEQFLTAGKVPATVDLKSVRFTADRHVAEDSPKLWGWIIFPEGFHAPRLMELARLQAWTLKPALLVR